MTEDHATPEAAADPWDLFALAACAPLGPFPQAHLAPKLAAKDLGVALRARLPLDPSEFLIATIDHEVGGVPSPILLTNRRLFWFEESDERPAEAPRRGPSIRGSSAEYLYLGDEIPVRAGERGGVELDLGGGRIVRSSSATPELGLALAATLRSLGEAARAGFVPVVEPDRARRIAEALPMVVAADRRLRAFGADVASFQADLLAATPRAFVTPTLVAACVGVFAAMVATGVDPMLPSPDDLLPWGANDAVRVALAGEWWRLPASVFLHGGLLHLAMNMWCLVNIGPLAERFYGNLGFAAVYLAAGIGGALASMATAPARVSVGASGAIFGILGALLAFLLVNRRSVPASVLGPLRSSALAFVVFNTLFGAVAPGIDQAAHMGGLATGFLSGLVLARPWPARSSARDLARSAFRAVVVAAVVTAVGAGAVRWRAGTIDDRERFGEFARRLAPPYERFLKLAEENDRVVDLLNQGRDDPQAREELPGLVGRMESEGRANLAELESLRSAEPELQAMAERLAAAQREQVAALEAVRRYEETGDRAWLEGPEGFVARVEASIRLERERRDLERAYLRERGLAGAGDGRAP